MGQYYLAVEFDRGGCLERVRRPLALLLLTHHSYFGNPLVNNVLKDIEGNPMRIVWAGDYADPEQGMEDSLYDIVRGRAVNCEEDARPDPRFRYLVNHSKRVYIDISRYLKQYNTKKKNTYILHPLPLLTAEGNTRGDGDYIGTYMNYVGLWSRDLISMESGIPVGFEENRVFFKETTTIRIKSF